MASRSYHSLTGDATSDTAPPTPRPPAAVPQRTLTPAAVLALQRTAGNAAVQRALLQRSEAEKQQEDTGATPGTIWGWLSWAGIGLADLIAGILGWFGIEDYDISADFLRHYMSGGGADYELAMPPAWAETIAAKKPRTGTFKDVSAYNWGNRDMKNSLGHFSLEVEEIAGGGKLYTVTDRYWFPFKPNDKDELGRHGFEVDFFGALPQPARDTINAALKALGTWQNPGGFQEHFEVKIIDKKWTFMIPQQFLADCGTDFNVHSSFLVTPDGTVVADDGGWF